MDRRGKQQHTAVATLLSPPVLGSLRAIDYNESPLGTVPYTLIATAGETEEYKWLLRDSILTVGILPPALIVQREGQQIRLVDGHHRCRVAYDLGMDCPAELHLCACPSDQLDYFGLCPATLARVKELQEAQHAV